MWICTLKKVLSQDLTHTPHSGVVEPTSSQVRFMPYFDLKKVNVSCCLSKRGRSPTFRKICTNLIFKEAFPMLSFIHFVWHSHRVWTCISLKHFTMLYQILHETLEALLANFSFLYDWRMLIYLTSNCIGLSGWILHWWQHEAFRCTSCHIHPIPMLGSDICRETMLDVLPQACVRKFAM